MDQTIGYCNAPDGTRIAYAVSGHGSPLVRAATSLTHVTADQDGPVWGHWWRELSRDHTLIRYDQRGCGLSQWNAIDFSLEARVNDLETVVNDLSLDPFVLLGHSVGAAVAVEYAARHPKQVTHLMLVGPIIRPISRWFPVEAIEAHATLLRATWDHPAAQLVNHAWLMPDAPIEVRNSFSELLRVSSSRDNSSALLTASSNLDVTDRLQEVVAPILVVQSSSSEFVPVEEARFVASVVPGARLVEVASSNHLLREDEPGWAELLREFRAFVGQPVRGPQGGLVDPKVASREGISTRESEVIALIADGLTDREIAQALNITARTASNHVKSVLAKSGSSNRAQVVAWSARKKLLRV